MSLPDDHKPIKSISLDDRAAMLRLTKADLAFFRRLKRKYRVRVTSRVEAEQLERLYGKETLPGGTRLFTIARKLDNGGVDYLYTAYRRDSDPSGLSEDFCHQLYWIIAIKLGGIKRFQLEVEL